MFGKNSFFSNPGKHIEKARKRLKKNHPGFYSVADHLVHATAKAASAVSASAVFASTGNPVLAASVREGVEGAADGTKAAIERASFGIIKR